MTTRTEDIELRHKMSHKDAILAWDITNSEEDSIRYDYDELCEDLTRLMQEVNPSNEWYCEVKNFGWRKLNGTKEFHCDNGKKFLREILPDTDCTFYIHKIERHERPCIAIQNYHHDSPTGNEWYYCDRLDKQEV